MLKKNIIQIISPARLHFGFLEINGNQGDNLLGGIGLSIDKTRQEVLLEGQVISLSSTEYEALLLFIEHSSETLDREFLVENLRGISWQSYDRSVDVLVSRLRSKLGETPNDSRFIKTIHGVGYKFVGKLQN